MGGKNSLIIENLIKNLILAIVLAITFTSLKSTMNAVSTESTESIILFSSLILVAALFANFSFTYEFSNIKNWKERFLSHATTFTVMLVIGLSLEMSYISIGKKIPILELIFLVLSLMVYLSAVLYDFWDLMRAKI